MVAQVGSLILTGFLVWNTTVGPRLMFEPLPIIILHALFTAALACLLSAGIAAGLFVMLPRRDFDTVAPRVFRTAAVAVWFAPACILLSQLSPATLIAALVLVIAATRLLYSEWTAENPPAVTEGPAKPLGLFGSFTVRRPLVTRELLTGLAAALAVQSGVLAVWKHRPLLAGACFVLSAAITTLFALVSGAVGEEARPPSLPRSVIGMAMTILLAAGLTVGGMRGLRGHGSGGGSGDSADGVELLLPEHRGAAASAKEVLKDLFGEEDKASKEKGPYTPKPPSADPGLMPDGSFPGVILMPEVKPVTRLVMPPPQGISTGDALAQPYGIPFDGPYLYYRWPALRPPPTSILQRGTPAALAFSTTDKWPLTMEAIQKFDDPIDLSCCRSVKVEIWNADRFPGTVSLELFCNDHRLGAAPVRSVPDLQRDPLVAVPETLEIPAPAGGSCRELKVSFRRDRSRADKSARIAIDRFVLVP
jgi:hypothetical protein